MLTWCLLGCFVLGVASADNPEEGLTCTTIKPLTTLNITQLQGKWINFVTLDVNMNATTPEIWSYDVSSTDGGSCSSMSVATNEDETVVTMVGKGHGPDTEANYTVDTLEKGRWIHHGEEGDLILADPDRYFFKLICYNPPDGIYGAWYSRYNSTGAFVVNREEMEKLVARGHKLLGITNVLTFHKDSC